MKNWLNDNVVCVIVAYYPNVNVLEKQVNLLSSQVSKIVIVDNSPEVIEMETQVASLVKYIKNSTNLGIAAAHNIGIKWALDNGYSHVLLMDQDSLPADNMVAELLAGETYLISKGIKVGAVAPYYYDKISHKNVCMSRKVINNVSEVAKDTSLISSGTLIKSEVLRDVGYMNDWLFIDGVDDDWCCRATYKGYELFHIAKAKLFHSLGQSKKKFGGLISFRYHQPFRYYFMFRNYIFLIKQPYVNYVMKYHYVYTFVTLLGKILFLPNKIDYIKQTMRGIKDGLKSGK